MICVPCFYPLSAVAFGPLIFMMVMICNDIYLFKS